MMAPAAISTAPPPASTAAGHQSIPVCGSLSGGLPGVDVGLGPGVRLGAGVGVRLGYGGLSGVALGRGVGVGPGLLRVFYT